MESATALPSSNAPMVQGMRNDLVEADWPALNDDEARNVLRHFTETSTSTVEDPKVLWRSPRPMSAGAIIGWNGESHFLKRHHMSVRSPERLRAEHDFSRYLRDRGQSVPAILPTASGDTVVEVGPYVYELQESASGVDLYRDVPSWHPYASADHARSAGRALALFHHAARGYEREKSPMGVLTNSAAIVASTDPSSEIDRLLRDRPALARAVSERSFRDDVARFHLPAIEKAAPLLETLTPQWTHGDWHPSNLAWSARDPRAHVTGIFDLGLSNRTFAVHDLALALERSTVDWLDLAKQGRTFADLEASDALLDGYEEILPLQPNEAAALIALLPVVHFEFALSEVEYFAAVVHSSVNTDLAYDDYLVGHTRWFEETPGLSLLDHLGRRWD